MDSNAPEWSEAFSLLQKYTTSGETVKTFSGHKGPVTCVSWSPDGKRLASGSYDGTVKIWTLNGDELPTIPVEGQPRKAAWNPNRNELAAIYGDTVKIWNAENGKGLRDLGLGRRLRRREHLIRLVLGLRRRGERVAVHLAGHGERELVQYHPGRRHRTR